MNAMENKNKGRRVLGGINVVENKNKGRRVVGGMYM